MATRIEAVRLRRGQAVWLDGQPTWVTRVKHDPDRAVVLVDTTDERIIICRPTDVLTLDEDSPA
jgi:hypothetical protein